MVYSLRDRNLKRLRAVIWHAGCWCTWLLRNNTVIFQNAVVDLPAVFTQIQRLSLMWISYKTSNLAYIPFYLWCNSPLDSLMDLF